MKILSFVGQVLVRLIGADEHIYASYPEAMQWMEETDVLEMIVDKFSCSVSFFIGLITIKFFFLIPNEEREIILTHL